MAHEVLNGMWLSSVAGGLINLTTKIDVADRYANGSGGSRKKLI